MWQEGKGRHRKERRKQEAPARIQLTTRLWAPQSLYHPGCYCSPTETLSPRGQCARNGVACTISLGSQEACELYGGEGGIHRTLQSSLSNHPFAPSYSLVSLYINITTNSFVKSKCAQKAADPAFRMCANVRKTACLTLRHWLRLYRSTPMRQAASRPPRSPLGVRNSFS